MSRLTVAEQIRKLNTKAHDLYGESGKHTVVLSYNQFIHLVNEVGTEELRTMRFEGNWIKVEDDSFYGDPCIIIEQVVHL